MQLWRQCRRRCRQCLPPASTSVSLSTKSNTACATEPLRILFYAQHWARDWRALALTQVHHWSRLSDSAKKRILQGKEFCEPRLSLSHRHRFDTGTKRKEILALRPPNRFLFAARYGSPRVSRPCANDLGCHERRRIRGRVDQQSHTMRMPPLFDWSVHPFRQSEY